MRCLRVRLCVKLNKLIYIDANTHELLLLFLKTGLATSSLTRAINPNNISGNI